MELLNTIQEIVEFSYASQTLNNCSTQLSQTVETMVVLFFHKSPWGSFHLNIFHINLQTSIRLTSTQQPINPIYICQVPISHSGNDDNTYKQKM